MVFHRDRHAYYPVSTVTTDVPRFSLGTSRPNCRLLYLVGRLHTGGYERQLYYILQAMDRERYQPAVVVWNYGDEDVHVPRIRELGVPLYAFSGNASAAAKLRAFRRLVRKLEPEVVHSYSFYTNIAAYWAVRGTQATAVGSVRNDFPLEKKSAGLWLGRLSARWPQHQICNSYAAAEAIHRSRSPFAPRQLCVVRNGLDIGWFQRRPMPTAGPVRIVGVGYLLPAKRWDRLLVATLELKRRGFNCPIQIAGDGPLLGALEQQAHNLGVADRVTFLGHVDDIPRLVAHATFLVHTADNEGCPNAVMEAMACGRAVAATDAGDIPSLIEDGTTGFVVPRGDTAMLVERMATLMTDRGLCQRMGEAGRVKAEREFGLDRLVEETLAAYRASGWKDAAPRVAL